MRKFKYAIGIAAMALFGACSSDMPEVVNNGVDDGEDTNLYLAINLGGTRAHEANGDAKEYTNESSIKKVQLILLDKNTKDLYFQTTTNVTGSSITGNTAKFAVSTSRFNDIIEHQNDLEMLVYVNGNTTIQTVKGLLNGKATTALYPGGEGAANTLGFIMASANYATVSAHQAAQTGKDDAPWILNANVELVRLATRFDYEEKTGGNSYNLTATTACKLKVAHMDIETFGKETYRIPHFTKNGKDKNAEGTAWTGSDVKYFDITDADKVATPAWYRMTDVETISDDERTMYKDFDYPIDVLNTTPKLYTYARPNTISTDITSVGKAQYNCVPFAVIRAQFTCEGSKSMEAHDPVYAVNGIYIGGMKDLIELKKTLDTDAKIDAYTIAHTLTETADVSKMNDVIKNFRSALKSDKIKTGYTSDDEAYVFGLMNAEKYTYTDEDWGKGYFTYYAHFIQHSELTSPSWKYGVSRNTVYELGVDSFKFLGNTGSGYPGDGPDISDLSDLFIQVTVTPKKWTLNSLNTGWAL